MMMRRRARRSIGVACAAALTGGVACAPPERPTDTVVYASGADLESANPLVTIHPLARQVQRFALFVTLVRLDASLTARPYFARTWTWSPDRRRLTLSLAPNLQWHDGPPVTARDVRFTIDAARDPATGYARSADLAAIDGVRILTDTSCEIVFARAQPDLPAVFAELPILPAHLLASVPRDGLRRAAFNFAPVGNGPFRFVARDPGHRWIFERNERFPAALGGPPRLRRLVIAVVDEPTTKFAGLVSGELDVAGIAPAMARLAEADPSLRVESYPVLFASALVFNTARAPFDEADVRRAIGLAIDRGRIVDAALAGFAVPAVGPVSPDNPLAITRAPAHDPRAADSLFDAADWRRGADGWRRRAGRLFEIELLTVGSGDNAVEQLLQADFAARGIRMHIRPLELGAFLTRARERRKSFDALLTLIPGDLSLSYLTAMFDSRQAGGALDYAGHHTDRLDTLFARVSAATDTAVVRAVWTEIQHELKWTMPVVWIYHARGVQGVANRLRGVTMDLRGEMPTVTEWYIAGQDAALTHRARR